MNTDFGIVVALDVEYKAVKQHLSNTKKNITGSLSVIEGKLSGYNVVLLKTSSLGSVCSALAAADLVTQYQPRHLVLLGIAAGIPDEVKRGDVVVADPIIGYEYSKVYDDSTDIEPRPYRNANKLVRFYDDEPISLTALFGGRPRSFRVKVAPMASGSKTVASKNFRDRLPRYDRKLAAIEMEAEGLAEAALHYGRECLVIKGISDFADKNSKGRRRNKKAQRNHDKWQAYSAQCSVNAFIKFLKHCKRNKIIEMGTPTTAPPTHMKRSRRGLGGESDFLKDVKKASLKLGSLELKCKLMPEGLWNVERRRDYIFFDDPEQRKRIILNSRKPKLPGGLLNKLVRELDIAIKTKDTCDSIQARDLSLYKKVYQRLKKRGSNAYPRIVAPPEVVSTGSTSRLRIAFEPSRYGVSLIVERQIPLPTANALQLKHVLNSLAVRVAVSYKKDGQTWVEFHQRRKELNATYPAAWDVGAAGYIDLNKHFDPEAKNRISPWQACAFEISEELNIDECDLPYRENYSFFGLARNDLTGQLDILASCELPEAPDPQRKVASRAIAYGRCLLTPESVSSFVLDKHYWVPTALLTMVLLLHAQDFPMRRIEEAFRRCVGRLKLET